MVEPLLPLTRASHTNGNEIKTSEARVDFAQRTNCEGLNVAGQEPGGGREYTVGHSWSTRHASVVVHAQGVRGLQRHIDGDGRGCWRGPLRRVPGREGQVVQAGRWGAFRHEGCLSRDGDVRAGICWCAWSADARDRRLAVAVEQGPKKEAAKQRRPRWRCGAISPARLENNIAHFSRGKAAVGLPPCAHQPHDLVHVARMHLAAAVYQEEEQGASMLQPFRSSC